MRHPKTPSASFINSPSWSQRGAAILTAMLTVVLVASLASATLWQQWRGVEVEAAERSRIQAAWVLTGALDWARLILREDARKGGADHLAEPWAVPLEQARLSTFLAADRSDALAADETQEAFLSGRIVDLQSRLNLLNLIQDGKIHEPSRLAFAKLFDVLSLPSAELAGLADKLRQAQEEPGASSATDASRVIATAAVPLWPQDEAQLAWFGLSPRTIAALRPFVTILPVRTPVNLNTAPVEVVYACIDAFDMADARRLLVVRELTPITAWSEAGKLAGNLSAQFNEGQHSVSSRFFEVFGTLRIDQSALEEQSVVQRDGLDVKTLWRKRSVLPSISPTTIPAEPRV